MNKTLIQDHQRTLSSPLPTGAKYYAFTPDAKLTSYRYHIPSPQMYLPPCTANATLINGRGRYAGGPMSPLAVINVEQGKRYRFRIIGASCDPWFNFTIDGHAMTVIETDGVETEPLVVDSLARVCAGQRYSVVVTANQTLGNYWIRAKSSHSNQTFDGG